MRGIRATVLVMDDPVFSHGVVVWPGLLGVFRGRPDAQGHAREDSGLEYPLLTHERYADATEFESSGEGREGQDIAVDGPEVVEELECSLSDLGVSPECGHGRHGCGARAAAQALPLQL